MEHHPKGYAYTTGLQTCKSVWACPICSFKIRTKRAIEIAVAIAVHKAKGGSVMLLTLTTQHSFGESLDEVWDQVQECWSYIIKHYRYTQLRKKLGLAFIRTIEVMHGINGWHPHLHVLLFSDVPIDPFDTRDQYHEIARIFHDLWVQRMKEKYGRDVRSSYGVDLRMVKADDAKGVGTYCTKAGYEVAMADGKEGRTRTSRHPFAIAYDAVETGDTRIDRAVPGMGQGLTRPAHVVLVQRTARSGRARPGEDRRRTGRRGRRDRRADLHHLQETVAADHHAPATGCGPCSSPPSTTAEPGSTRPSACCSITAWACRSKRDLQVTRHVCGRLVNRGKDPHQQQQTNQLKEETCV